jgi:hypothetical protein
MHTLNVLALLAVVAVVGGALLALVAMARSFIWRFRSAPLYASRIELSALAASVAAAVLAVLWLLVGPFYSGFSGSGSISLGGTASLSAVAGTRSFYAVNGTKVIPFLALPILIALVPFAAARRGARAAVQGLCALLLGGQAVIGMSGYGLLFAPSGVLMLAAGILALNNRAA